MKFRVGDSITLRSEGQTLTSRTYFRQSNGFWERDNRNDHFMDDGIAKYYLAKYPRAWYYTPVRLDFRHILTSWIG